MENIEENNLYPLLTESNGNLPRTKEEKELMIKRAEDAYSKFLIAVGFHFLADENSRDTPRRVAKAWVNDIISGTNTEKPKITTFPSNYTGIVFDGNIEVTSLCSHHNLAFSGKAYIGYIPGGRVIGLSKLNRIVDWYSRRPQIQEGLTQQIHDDLSNILENNNGVMVVIDAMHTCCSHRGIKHKSSMITASASKYFLENKDGCKDEFYQFINKLK